MRIYFLGCKKSTRSYNRQYFYVFFGVVKQNEKATHWSIVPCLSSFIKMKDQKKRRNFIRVFIYCSCPLSHFRAWHPLHIHMGGFSVASGSRLFHRVHSPPTGYSSSHPWHLVSVSSSQCCRVILSDIPISLKIVCPKAYSLSSPSYQSPCVSLTFIITSSTLVSCRLMEDTSRPPFDGFLPVDLSTSSGNEI